MRHLLSSALLLLLLAGCTEANKDKKETEAVKVEGVPVSEVKLPFELARPYQNWQMGSTENVAAAMTGLKTFIDKDFAGLAAVTGDSVELVFDYFHTKLNRDSAIKFFMNERAKYSEVNITMYDYESVISADKKSEWVTLWYKQVWKDPKGMSDSMNVVDDIRIKDGKMVELDEKVSHFPKK